MAVQTIQQQVDTLMEAVGAGNLIDSDLKVVNKHGWEWKILSVVKWILSPLYSCLGMDAFQHYRIHNVSQAILKLCENNAKDLTPQLKTKVVTHLLGTFDIRSKGKYTKDIEAVRNSILSLGTAPGDPINQRKALVQNAVAQFAHQLHMRLANLTPNASICFSPVSIIPVLGMILKGMPEERKQIFLANMGLGALPEPIVHIGMMEILDDIASASGDLCSIRYANALAAPVEALIHADYKRGVARDYKGEIFPISLEAEEACKAINDWISEKTNGHIKDLLKPDDLKAAENDPRKAFALLNAIYFEGKWEKKFREAVNEPFHFAHGGDVQVKMMSLGKTLACYTGDTFRMLEIPYKSPQGHKLAHLVFLPNPGQNLTDLEARLTPALIAQCRQTAVKEYYDVKMPKIDVNVKVDHLLDTLHEMGIPLKGALPLLGEDAEIKKIIHQAKVKVDEEGTVAAAATAAIGMCMACAPPPPPKTFYIDRDYAYYIVDNNTILFQGNVKDPQALTR